MANTTYAEKLKDPRWQKMRLKVLERDNWACQQCGDDKSSLHVHHRYYLRGKEPWGYPDQALVTLCETCHKEETELMPEVIETVADCLKTLFLAGEIMTVFVGVATAGGWFEDKKGFPFPPKVTAKAINWALTNDEMIEEIPKRYTAYLREIANEPAGELKND